MSRSGLPAQVRAVDDAVRDAVAAAQVGDAGAFDDAAKWQAVDPLPLLP